ncbi:MAG: hypothetical protein E4G98_06805 [Promethearchaeota archaeon]|nr:MAG: hypothetical protein E4G98_06805 [Candidatus Lokiarchaeota archaeon]
MVTSHRKLWTFRSFFTEIESQNQNSKRAVLEVAGKDSVAAAIPYLQTHPITELIGIGIFHRGFYDNFYEPELNFQQISTILRNHVPELQTSFYYLDVADLFDWTIVQPMGIIQKHFSQYSPCPPCHLFFHMMRIPLVKHLGATQILTGERAAHDAGLKLNQLPEILGLFTSMMQKQGISLKQPIKNINDDSKIFALLGREWKSVEPFRCIFSKNYLDENGQLHFNVPNLTKTLSIFYYPLFNDIIQYIMRKHCSPDLKWIQQKIQSIISDIPPII